MKKWFKKDDDYEYWEPGMYSTRRRRRNYDRYEYGDRMKPGLYIGLILGGICAIVAIVEWLFNL